MPTECARRVDEVMAKRSDRGSGKADLCLAGKHRAKPVTEISSDLANDHQGNGQPGLVPRLPTESPDMRPQSLPAFVLLQKTRLPQGRRPYKKAQRATEKNAWLSR